MENSNTIVNNVKQTKDISPILASGEHSLRNNVLLAVKEALHAKKSEIFGANKCDIELAESSNLPSPLISRLKFDEEKLKACLKGIDNLLELEDPVGKILLKRQLDDGLTLEQITCPIGVIGVIFESRPDALVQISTLCIKSGNAAVLKGGSEAAATNRILFDIIYEAGISAGLPENFMLLIESRSDIGEILKLHDCIDLIIPRGSNEFVQHIMSNSKIPVMGHADGICHIYVDVESDMNLAAAVVNDSKLQYAAACNTLETLLLHESIAEEFMNRLDKKIVPVFNGESVEHLSNKLTVRVVKSIDDAIRFINKNGSHHTDCIITNNSATAEKFLNLVDSAGVYHNCSTRFADGFRYGLGAEVGISTGKLHARGPVGLQGLVTYKYKLRGDGHVVCDYSTGKSSFKFKDL